MEKFLLLTLYCYSSEKKKITGETPEVRSDKRKPREKKERKGEKRDKKRGKERK